MKRQRKWRNRVILPVAAVALTVVGSMLAGAPLQAGGLVAAGGGVNTFELSGALRGTLHDGPLAGCPYGGINTNGFVLLNDLVGSVSGMKGVASWGLDVNVKKNGTFKFKSLPIGKPNAELNVTLKSKSIAAGVLDSFYARGGSVTVKGESGSINATMSENSGKTLKLVGRWACGAPAANSELSGPGWKIPVQVDHTQNKTSDLTSVSCPTASFSAAVDDRGYAFTLMDGTWSEPAAINQNSQSDMDDVMQSVSCASPSFCVAGDELRNVYTYDGSGWSSSDQLDPSVTTVSVSFSVSCPTTSFCMAVDGSNDYFTYDGTSWSGAQELDTTTDNSLVIGEVSCSVSSFCEAVFGAHTYTYNGSTWSAPQTLPSGSGAGATAEVEAVSCPTPTFCAASGTTGNNEGYLDTFNGTSWSVPVIRKTDLGPQMFAGVSCPSDSFCMAPGLDGWVTYNGSTWSNPQTFSDPGGPVAQGPPYANAVSCASAKACEEVQDLGYADAWNV